MKQMKPAPLGALAVGLSISVCNSALGESPDHLDQITISGARPNDDSSVAMKTDTPLIQTPQSISVISADQIELQGAQSLGEALRYSAGVNPEQYGGVDQRIDWFMIRGFPSSAPYIDGLTSHSRYTLLSAKIDPWGLDRIEVLRGPSSVLYGQNVPGGLINVVSKRPQQNTSGDLGVQTGSYGRFEARADVTGPVNAEHTLLYRLTGSVLDTGTQVDHVDNHHYFFAPALTWLPNEHSGVTFLGHFLRQDDGFALQNLPAAGTLYPSPLGQVSSSFFTGEPSLNFATLTQWDLGYNAQHRFSSNWALHQNLRYTHTIVGVGYVAGYGQEADQAQIMDRFALDAHAHQNNFAVDTNLEGHLATGIIQHTVLLGVDYSRSHDFWSEADGNALPLDITHPVYGGPIDVTLDYVTDDTVAQTGLYLQDQMKLDHWALTGSVRRDWAQTRTIDVLYGPDLEQHDHAVTGRGGFVYLFDNGLAPYASYSTSFQPTVGSTFDGTPLNPTTAKQWEAGLKYQPTGWKSSAMVSAYRIAEKNVTTADPDPQHPNQVVQTGGARVDGIELSADLNLGYGVSSNLAYTYMSSRITAASDDTLGKQLMDVSRHSASVWLTKGVAVTEDQQMIVGGGIRYLGPRFGDNSNTLLLPSTTQFDAVARYSLRNWQVSLNVRNLTDKLVIATCDSTARCFYNERRSILGSIDYRW